MKKFEKILECDQINSLSEWENEGGSTYSNKKFGNQKNRWKTAYFLKTHVRKSGVS